MPLRMLLIVLTAISLCGCPQDSAPKEPDTKVWTPIYVLKDGMQWPTEYEALPDPMTVDWEKSYMFGVLRKEPSNPAYFERVYIFKFLSGEAYKPRCMRGDEYVDLSLWEIDVNEWSKVHCK